MSGQTADIHTRRVIIMPYIHCVTGTHKT